MEDEISAVGEHFDIAAYAEVGCQFCPFLFALRCIASGTDHRYPPRRASSLHAGARERALRRTGRCGVAVGAAHVLLLPPSPPLL